MIPEGSWVRKERGRERLRRLESVRKVVDGVGRLRRRRAAVVFAWGC